MGERSKSLNPKNLSGDLCVAETKDKNDEKDLKGEKRDGATIDSTTLDISHFLHWYFVRRASEFADELWHSVARQP